jgi:hypothetical protein
VFPFFVDYFNTMACYACPVRLPVGHGSNQPTKCDGQTKNRKCKPKKGNDEISSKSQKKTTGGARTPSYKLRDKLVFFQSQYQEKN